MDGEERREKNIEDSNKIMKGASIGFVVILVAYALVEWLMEVLM